MFATVYLLCRYLAGDPKEGHDRRAITNQSQQTKQTDNHSEEPTMKPQVKETGAEETEEATDKSCFGKDGSEGGEEGGSGEESEDPADTGDGEDETASGDKPIPKGNKCVANGGMSAAKDAGGRFVSLLTPEQEHTSHKHDGKHEIAIDFTSHPALPKCRRVRL